MLRRTVHDRVRVYATLRTAHLERAHALVPASIVYRDRRYDFDPALAQGLDLVQAGPWRTAAVLARSRVRTLEINEPLMLSSLRRSLLAVAVVRAAALVRRARVQVVTYAIGNDDPFRAPGRPGLRGRVRRASDRAALRLVAGQVDRVAYGTADAHELYRRLVPGMSATTADIPALPAPCPCEISVERDPDRVLFLGAFDGRKGVERLMAAWPHVAAGRPSSTLVLVGTGPLVDRVRDFVAQEPTARLVEEPPREEVHRELRGAAVVVLLSQPTPTWREQVGLPLVEGLAHGCTVLASTQTGLAGWLRDHGHGVLEPDAGAQALAAEVLRLLDARRSTASVLGDLPHQDGRLAADAWLFRDAPGPPTTAAGAPG